MLLHISLLSMILSTLTLHALSYKICEVRDQRVFCQCDDYEVDEVRTVTCTFIGNVTSDDEIWGGFEDQRLVESISLNGRGSGALTGVPVRIFASTRQVNQMTFTDNRLGVLRAYSFHNLDKLQLINMERNDITGLEDHVFSNLNNLTNLILSENFIRTLPSDSLHHLPNLKELFLDRNELESIMDQAFSHLHNLQEMDLFTNNLNHISPKTFSGLRSLRRLDLSKNSLVSLKDRIFRGAPNLNDLDLSRNRITEITSHAFDGLKHLQRLNLKDNKLFNLAKTVFKGAPHLIHINLAENKLVTLPKHLLDPLVNVSNHEFLINLKGNPFECRCDLLWISSFVNNSKTFAESVSLKKELRSMKCFFGEHRKANIVNVTDLRREEMTCPDPPIMKTTIPMYIIHHPHTHPTTTTTTSTTTTASTIARQKAMLSASEAEPKQAESSTIKDAAEASVGKIEAKNIELSDAAESEVANPKAAEKKVQPTNSGSQLTCFLPFVLLYTFSKCISNA